MMLREAWLQLILTPGLGAVRINRLLKQFADPQAILAADPTELAHAGVKAEQIKSLHSPDESRIDAAQTWLDASHLHHILTIHDTDYPGLLKSTENPPPLLFVNGDRGVLAKLQLAIVGSRNPSANGLETAHDFAGFLAKADLVITSGMALGIDAASHYGALDAGGQTIAVAGTGLDRVYPARHRELAHRIAENGALISEFPPGTRPLPQNFPQRNRIISGLSLGVLVVEAAKKSGSLITAYKALEQSREVFAIPGSIHNPLARGCHQLIREGAKLVETGQDVLEELAPLARLAMDMGHSSSSEKKQDTDVSTVNDEHKHVLEAMGYDPVSIDSLVERTGLTAAELSSILLILELNGQVMIQPGGFYVRKSH
ncbi:MAG: DNA-protecting protein DprA [Gammaproteobacteria bacterium]|nr:MAG: DNA-protecting protein DprA [Gammaproteobacteria bacterium]